MIILDASALIAYIHKDDVHHHAVTAFLEENVDEPFGASAISIAECLVRPARHGVIDQAQRTLTALDLEVFAIQASDAMALAETRARTGLRLPDAAVVHTARQQQAAILTTDKKLAAASTADGVFGHVPE